MRKIRKRCILMVMAVMVLFTMTPHTAEAAAKKSVTVSVKNAAKSKGKYQLTVKKSAQLVVKYGKSNVTKKAKYTVSNKKIATVSKKGKVTAKKTGNVTVTVKYKGKTKKVKFTVTKPSAAKPAPQPAPEQAETPKTGHQHNWVLGTVNRQRWVSDIVKVTDYTHVPVEVYVCGCGEKVYENVESHKKAHEDVGEIYSGYQIIEDSLVEDGYHWEDHGHWENYLNSEYVCSICKKPMEDD